MILLHNNRSAFEKCPVRVICSSLNDDLLLYSISRGVLACTATESLNKSTDPYCNVLKQRQANSALFQTDWQQSNADF